MIENAFNDNKLPIKPNLGFLIYENEKEKGVAMELTLNPMFPRMKENHWSKIFTEIQGEIGFGGWENEGESREMRNTRYTQRK